MTDKPYDLLAEAMRSHAENVAERERAEIAEKERLRQSMRDECASVLHNTAEAFGLEATRLTHDDYNGAYATIGLLRFHAAPSSFSAAAVLLTCPRCHEADKIEATVHVLIPRFNRHTPEAILYKHNIGLLGAVIAQAEDRICEQCQRDKDEDDEAREDPTAFSADLSNAGWTEVKHALDNLSGIITYVDKQIREAMIAHERDRHGSEE